jgi:hypothetical protein
VFRDVIIEADYNPLKYASQGIKVRTDDIRDPCMLDEWKAKREASLVRLQIFTLCRQLSPLFTGVLSSLMCDTVDGWNREGWGDWESRSSCPFVGQAGQYTVRKEHAA